MKIIIAIILWCILLSLCWPLAFGLLFVLPVVWLILLPFSILGFTVALVLKVITGILLLPFRILQAL